MPHFFNYLEFNPTKMMTAEDVIHAGKIHEIGAHSYYHSTMEFETDEYFYNDLLKCKLYFDKVLNMPLLIYAFPNGSYRNSQIKIATELGCKFILLVDGEFSKASVSVHKRFGFTADSRREAYFRLTGGFSKMSYKLDPKHHNE
jgi:peptidoglycan/xylan/chitin deacetylase (PgdA/CDA1 family)